MPVDFVFFPEPASRVKFAHIELEGTMATMVSIPI